MTKIFTYSMSNKIKNTYLYKLLYELDLGMAKFLTDLGSHRDPPQIG